MVSQPASYTYDEVISNFPHEKRLNTLQCVEGREVTVLWEGLRLRDILNASLPNNNSNTVIFHSIDGYTTSLPLESVIDNNYLLAYKINEIILPPDRGYPFSLVADGKWGYKWARWVERIEISSDPSYRGYWEQRGYAAGGDLNESFYS